MAGLNERALSPEPRSLELAGRLLVLAGPVIATNISRTVMSFVDFLMVSRLGAEAQAAIVPARLILFCMISVGLGLVSAVNTFVAQSLGRGRFGECSAYAWQGLYLALAAGVVLLPCWWLVEPFFTWAGNGPGVVPLEIAYTQIGILGIAPAIAAAAMANFFTGVHRPAVGLVSVLVSNVVNVVANYALIFGHFGCPAMGIAGAAWATLGASTLQAIILLSWMLLPRYGRTYGSWHTWRFHARRFLALVRVGGPSGGQLGTDIITWTLFTILLVGRFGEVQLAANNICFTVLELSFMPAVGLGMALTASVGRSIGEGRHDLARRYVRWGLVFNMGYMGLLGALMAVFRYELPELLTSPTDPLAADVIAAAAPLMVMCALFQAFDAMCITFNRALQGAGDTLWPAGLFIASSVLVLLLGGWLMARYVPALGSIGPWLAATVHVMIAGTALWARYRFGPWERIRLAPEEAPARA